MNNESCSKEEYENSETDEILSEDLYEDEILSEDLFEDDIDEDTLNETILKLQNQIASIKLDFFEFYTKILSLEIKQQAEMIQELIIFKTKLFKP